MSIPPSETGRAASRRRNDPDELLDAVADAILKTRARGLGKRQWARRAAATAIEIIAERRREGAVTPRRPTLEALDPYERGVELGKRSADAFREALRRSDEAARISPKVSP